MSVKDVVLVEPSVFEDERGFFMEAFKRSDFLGAGIDFIPVQENHSLSKKGVLRGLHYQTDPYVQGKLVRVVRGRVFDVAVDLRKSSATFGRWVGEELSERNRLMLYIPRGFAHGFISLEDGTEVVYLADSQYSKANERGVVWNDPEIGVAWLSSEPILNERDAGWQKLSEAELFP